MTAMSVAHAYELPDEPGRDLVLPAEQLEAAEHGDVIPLTRNGKPVAFLAPADPDQAWYWTEEWQAGEREIAREQMQGKPPQVYDNLEDFFSALDRDHSAS